MYMDDDDRTYSITNMPYVGEIVETRYGMRRVGAVTRSGVREKPKVVIGGVLITAAMIVPVVYVRWSDTQAFESSCQLENIRCVNNIIDAIGSLGHFTTDPADLIIE